MLKETIISRNSLGATQLTHNIVANTYGSAPTLATDGFYIRCAASRNYDAYEALFSFDGTATILTKAVVRPWFWVPDHDPGAAGGTWLAGKFMENISTGAGSTDVFAAVRRINSVPVAATRCYLQVVSVVGFIPVDLYMTVMGIEGIVAEVDMTDVSVELDVGDVSVMAPFTQATHTTPVSFTAAFATANTILCASAPFVIDEANCRVVFVLYRHVGDLWSAPLVNGIGGVSLTAAANVITLAGTAGAPLLAGDELWVGVQQRPVSGGGGGAAGGGDAIYTSPNDFSVTFLAPTQLTLTGLSYTPTLGQFVSVYYVDVAGMAKTLTPDTNAFAWNSGTGILTVTSATFAATDSYRVMVFGPDKSLDLASNSKRTAEISPANLYATTEPLVDATNVGAGTVYYPSDTGGDMLGYGGLCLQMVTSGGVTTTVEVTNDTAAVPDWLDITLAGDDLCLRSWAASYVDRSTMVDFDNLNVRAFRIKSITADASNAVQYNIRRKAVS
ncbi:MAG: hypothetical protein WC505_06790 [Patescibacteria group bacterium]